MIYLRLFHGRTDPAQDMDDWGLDGPIFGPYEFVHTTYSYHIKLGHETGSVYELFLFEDMLYYDGLYYGDWSVFGQETLEKGKYKPSPFEQEKANLKK